MEADGVSPSAISAFESNFNSLASGATGIIPESTIAPVPSLDKLTDLTLEPDSTLLAKTVVLKLNGGLGTGMGLDKAKSLLKVKGEDTFLDLTAKQVVQMRKDYGFKVKFMLMNSFSTSADTLAFLQSKYPGLAAEDGLEMLQNKVPKIDAETLEVRMYMGWGKCHPQNSPSPHVFLPHSFINRHHCHSPPHARPTPPTSGAPRAMETCTPHWLDPAVSTNC